MYKYWALLDAAGRVLILACYGESQEDFCKGMIAEPGEYVAQIEVRIL